MRAENLVVVVSRWFGGVLLGPVRFKIINDTGMALVEAQPWYAGRGGGGGGDAAETTGPAGGDETEAAATFAETNETAANVETATAALDRAPEERRPCATRAAMARALRRRLKDICE